MYIKVGVGRAAGGVRRWWWLCAGRSREVGVGVRVEEWYTGLPLEGKVTLLLSAYAAEQTEAVETLMCSGVGRQRPKNKDRRSEERVNDRKRPKNPNRVAPGKSLI